MSCPHLSGVAALIKSAHPNWSPAAIKSAILTTAYTYDLDYNPISTEQNVPATVFDMGSGHVDPTKALNPGLVYDIEPDDFVPYLCGLGYDDKQVRMIVQRKVNCSSTGSSIPEAQLNYPTFSISLGAGEQKKTYTRTVTNVGRPNSRYMSVADSWKGILDVEVAPREMSFKEVGEKASYSVTFTRLGNLTASDSTAVRQGYLVWSASTLFFPTFSFSHEASEASRITGMETYIVFVEKPEGLLESNLHEWYTTFLSETTSNIVPSKQRIVHSYRNVITGFAAKLTPQEAKAMEHKEGFISARVERPVSFHTTFTPKFLGLQHNGGPWKSSHYGKGVIIGLIDSGIKHDHPSFFDKGMSPPPARWRGRCDFNGKKTCNNKLLGARSFLGAGDTPVEKAVLHGSHTAAEAAGSPVEAANVFGQANGTAMGIAPKAHLAMYKVRGADSSVLAAIDAAIEDGVDVLSISMGYFNGRFPFFDDLFVLGAFRAIQKGIFVSCSAGNGGPSPNSVTNAAPWILTVGASTIDREIRATVTLGNNVELHGQSLFQPTDFHSKQLPLVDLSTYSASAAYCGKGSLKNIDIKGKIVMCQTKLRALRTDQGKEVKDNGGAGVIFINGVKDGDTTIPDAHVLPASYLGYNDGLVVKGYLNSTQSPTAAISFQGTLIGKSKIAPQVASFSSRGPSLQSPGILKPDIIGPGVNILAAWGVSIDNATTPFSVESGTSMSCPHLSGVAALIKSAHPRWSPAAIRSAILTTAYTFDLSGHPISNEQNVSATVFDMGSGHVNPSKALNPGLVYDIEPDDYIPYLCGLGYSDKQVRMIVQRKVNCSSPGSSIPEAQLNYPTFSISLARGENQTYTRTVTNVGQPNSTYYGKVRSLEGAGVAVTIVPSEIKFKEVNEKASYSVTFTRLDNVARSSDVGQGSLVWSSLAAVADGDDRYEVVSTIAVNFV
ncbi:unnamed protein product [Linum tenue]|nr:unnamed protein product [Linum tenue]